MNEALMAKKINLMVIYFLLILGSIIFFIPFLWLISTSLKPIEQTMTMPITFIPRAYYINYNNKPMKIRKDIEISKPGFIVKIEAGPEKGKKLLINSDDYIDGKARIEIQESDRVIKRLFKCEIIKKVQPGWIKVVQKLEEENSGVERIWTCVPKDQIESRIEFRWSNYSQLMKKIPFFKYLWNTLIVAFIGTIGMTISSALVAYGFSRIKWKGRNILFAVSIATMMIPFPVTMIPLYSVFKFFGMVGTLKPLYVPHLFASAFNIFLLRQFFMTLPWDISEAAYIDGCNEFQIFYKIILPLSKPALAVVALFHFMYCWNDFMGPLIYLNNPDTYTLALGLQQFQSKNGGTEWHLLMAMSVLIILPIIVLFFFTQKTFIKGIAMTGTKG